MAKFVDWCGNLSGLVWINLWTGVEILVDWCG